MKRLIVLMLCLALLMISAAGEAQDPDPEEYFNWAVNGETWVRLSGTQKTAWLSGFLHGLEVGVDAFGLVLSDAMVYERDVDTLIEHAEILNVDTPITQIREELAQYYSDPDNLDVHVAAIILIRYCAGAQRIIEAVDALDEKDRAAQSLFGL